MPFVKKLGLKKLVIILFFLAVVLLFIIFAKNAYPVPAGDSQFFLVPAIQFVKNGLLVSPLFPNEKTMDLIIDPTGMRRFLFEPPLFPLVLSYLMLEATPYGVFWALMFINIAVLLLSGFLFYKIVIRDKELSWFSVLLIVFSVLAIASSTAETGRPETLARLLVAIALFIKFYISRKYDWIFYGIILGLIFAIHPALGIISILALGIYFGITLNLKDFFLKGSAILLIAFLITLVVIKLGPFGIKETIEGTWANAVTVSHALSTTDYGFFEVGNLINRYLTSQTAPFYGILILFIFAIGLFAFLKNKKKIVLPGMVLLFGLALIFLLIKFVFPAGHVSYFTAFAPILFFVLIHTFLERGRYFKFFIIFIFVLVSIGFIRTTLLFPFFVKQNAHLAEARVDFAKLSSRYKNTGLIGITGGLWTLTENYEGVYSYNIWPENPKENTALIFFQQRYSSMLEPPGIESCKIIKDNFSRKVPKFLGMKLGSTMPGYGYAAYSCL